eukprot:COSAG01_NODE_1801_length_9200_cov_13.641358_2_plen_702_part_00
MARSTHLRMPALLAWAAVQLAHGGACPDPTCRTTCSSISCSTAQVVRAMEAAPADRDVQAHGCSALYDQASRGNQSAMAATGALEVAVAALKRFPLPAGEAYTNGRMASCLQALETGVACYDPELACGFVHPQRPSCARCSTTQVLSAMDAAPAADHDVQKWGCNILSRLPDGNSSRLQSCPVYCDGDGGTTHIFEKGGDLSCRGYCDGCSAAQILAAMEVSPSDLEVQANGLHALSGLINQWSIWHHEEKERSDNKAAIAAAGGSSLVAAAMSRAFAVDLPLDCECSDGTLICPTTSWCPQFAVVPFSPCTQLQLDVWSAYWQTRQRPRGNWAYFQAPRGNWTECRVRADGCELLGYLGDEGEDAFREAETFGCSRYCDGIGGITHAPYSAALKQWISSDSDPTCRTACNGATRSVRWPERPLCQVMQVLDAMKAAPNELAVQRNGCAAVWMLMQSGLYNDQQRRDNKAAIAAAGGVDLLRAAIARFPEAWEDPTCAMPLIIYSRELPWYSQLWHWNEPWHWGVWAWVVAAAVLTTILYASDRFAEHQAESAAAGCGCYYCAHASVVLLLCGTVVQEIGWWSLYSATNATTNVLGAAMVLVGAVCFVCAPGHLGLPVRRDGAQRRKFLRLVGIYFGLSMAFVGQAIYLMPATNGMVTYVPFASGVRVLLSTLILRLVFLELGRRERVEPTEPGEQLKLLP